MRKSNKFTTSLNYQGGIFALALLLALTALSLSLSAEADDFDSLVNNKLKEEFIKLDVEDQQTNLEYVRAHDNDVQPDAAEVLNPLPSRHPIVHDITANEIGEAHEDRGSRPQVGITRMNDLSEYIERNIIEKQAYEMYREHYRNAVQKEFQKRAKEKGIEVNRDIAAELKAREDSAAR